jgi:hypothetical protein
MPIRFRCAYCNQLMGIARRKAGTVVRCPTCSGQVVVPIPESPVESEAEEQPPQAPPPAPAPGLFDRSDFGAELFAGGAPGAARAGSPRSGGFLPVPQPQRAEPPVPAAGFDADPVGVAPGAHARPPAAPPGIFLTPGKVTVLAVFVVLLIGVAFFAGMLVGRS